MFAKLLITGSASLNIIKLETKLNLRGFDVLIEHKLYNIIKTVQKYKPDIIITCNKLKSTFLFKTCKELKRSPDSNAIPIIMLGKQNVNLALDAMIDDIILDPNDFDEIINRIHHFSRQKFELINLQNHLQVINGFSDRKDLLSYSIKFPKSIHVKLLGYAPSLIESIKNTILHSSFRSKIIFSNTDKPNPDLIIYASNSSLQDADIRALSRLKKLRHINKIPLFLLSRKPNDLTISTNLQQGANDYAIFSKAPDVITLKILSLLYFTIHKKILKNIIINNAMAGVYNSLTGLFSLRHSVKYLHKSITLYSQPISIMMLAIDTPKSSRKLSNQQRHFYQNFNLEAAIKIIKKNTRNMDVISNLGEKKILLTFANIHENMLQKIAERLIKRIQAIPDPYPEKTYYHQKIAVNISAATHEKNETFESLLLRTDRALKIIKKNKICQFKVSKRAA